MSVEIHPTAIVDPKAELEDGVFVGPYAIVERGVQVGKSAILEAHCILKENTRVGEACIIGNFTVLGGLPQHSSFDASIPSFVRLGDSVRTSEGVTVHRSIRENGVTEVGGNSFLMGYSHVAHDCKLGREVILANGVLLGGHVVMGDHVFVGGGAAFHQFVRVGDGAMIGGLAEVSADVPPQITVTGRNRASGLNLIGLRRRRVGEREISELKRLYRGFLQRSGNLRLRAEELLDSPEAPKTETGLGFVRFFLSGERNFARSLNLGKIGSDEPSTR